MEREKERKEHALLTPPPPRREGLSWRNTGKEGGEERGGGFYN
jgi:hypothetical protein